MDTRITEKDFFANGGYKNRMQYSTGSYNAGNLKYWKV